jgi:hypothetical protein
MKNIISLIAVVIMFCLGQLTLSYFFPDRATDFEVWERYYIAKDAVYDLMFFLIALSLFWTHTGKAKAISCFFVFVTGGSFIDKVIFNINQYLPSDILLIVLAAFVSIYLYVKRWSKT